MKPIATLLRALQLFAHRAHNDVRGPTFFQDHSFLGDAYDAYDDAFDSVIERMIGLKMNPDIAAINTEAAKLSSVQPNEHDADTLLKMLMASEKQLCALIKKAVPGCDDGTQNLLQGLADDSDMRLYKLQQRLA